LIVSERSYGRCWDNWDNHSGLGDEQGVVHLQARWQKRKQQLVGQTQAMSDKQTGGWVGSGNEVDAAAAG